MAEGFKKIPQIQVGEESLVAAKRANELIDLLNHLGNGIVAPIANVGTYKIGATGAVWDFSMLDARLKRIESMLFVNNTPPLENRVAAIETRLNNAELIANGECTGNNITINISLNI